MPGRARTGVEFHIVWRAAQEQLCPTAECDQVGRRQRQPAAGLEQSAQFLENGLRVEDMFDHLGRHDRGETVRHER